MKTKVNMNITLQKPSGETVAVVPVVADEHGYLYAEHPVYAFEVDCALYGFQDGGVSSDAIEDADGSAYMFWSIA
jgi:hypothetical protein